MPLKILKFNHVFRFLEKPDSIKQNHVFFKGQYLLEEIWAQERRYFNNISYLEAQKAPEGSTRYTKTIMYRRGLSFENTVHGKKIARTCCFFCHNRKKSFFFAIYIYLKNATKTHTLDVPTPNLNKYP